MLYPRLAFHNNIVAFPNNVVSVVYDEIIMEYFHASLFNIRNYSAEVINIQRLHSAISCSKLTIETLEQGAKYVQS